MYGTLLSGVVSHVVYACVGSPLGGGCVFRAVHLHGSRVARFGASRVFLETLGIHVCRCGVAWYAEEGGGVIASVSLRWVPLICSSGRGGFACYYS